MLPPLESAGCAVCEVLGRRCCRTPPDEDHFLEIKKKNVVTILLSCPLPKTLAPSTPDAARHAPGKSLLDYPNSKIRIPHRFSKLIDNLHRFFGRDTKYKGKLESQPTVTRLSLGCLILVRFLIQPFAKSYSLYRSKTKS